MLESQLHLQLFFHDKATCQGGGQLFVKQYVMKKTTSPALARQLLTYAERQEEILQV
jgi:hypothetical protein